MSDYGTKNPKDIGEPAGPKDISGSEPQGCSSEFCSGSFDASRNPNGTSGSLSLADVFSNRD